MVIEQDKGLAMDGCSGLDEAVWMASAEVCCLWREVSRVVFCCVVVFVGAWLLGLLLFAVAGSHGLG